MELINLNHQSLNTKNLELGTNDLLVKIGRYTIQIRIEKKGNKVYIRKANNFKTIECDHDIYVTRNLIENLESIYDVLLQARYVKETFHL